ncbi:MAG: glycosyltransferase family 9 protein [Candidatus Omnitrophica bacterium]|nr:glycosyltransferase family 9 protein [Candidatus Omnitrophota bacterium]
MKNFIKKVVYILGIGRIVRKCRFFGYSALDAIGGALFFILRVFGFMPSMQKSDETQIKKILIIRLDRIGDVILTTPAIRALRRTFPDAQIHMLINEYTKDLLVRNSNIDKLLIYKSDNLGRDYSLALVFHPGIRPNYLAFVSRAISRVGYAGRGGGFFLTHILKDDRETRVRHEVESALEIVGIIGCKAEDRKIEVSVTEEGECFAHKFFEKHMLNGTIVVIHPGARQSYIRWKKQGFAEVADKLMKINSVKVLIIGNESERPLVNEVGSLMKGRPVCAVGLRLTYLVSLIKRCSLFIGNSTGPMHIAAALNVPCVAIFGAMHSLDSYRVWGPIGNRHIIISSEEKCYKCHPSDCRDFRCMKRISAEEVFNAAQKLLANRN